MKKLLLFVTLLSSSALSFAKDKMEEPKDSERNKVQKLCKFLVHQNFVDKDHLCQGATHDESIVDELIKRGILEDIKAAGSTHCIDGW